MKPVIVFDLDDTLYPERDFVISGFKAVGDWLFATHQIAGCYQELIKLFESGVRETTFNQALINLNANDDLNIVQEMVSVYRNHLPTILLPQESIDILTTLKSHTHLAIITDGYAKTQRNKIKALQLDTYTDFIVYSDDWGRENWKPSALPYQVVENHFSAAKYTYIGDNIKKDFVTAKQLGWHTIQIIKQTGEYTGITLPENYHAHHCIHHLDEIIALTGNQAEGTSTNSASGS